MRTSLAWKNLVHSKVKTGVAVAGVVFAIVLMFMQLGFLEAVKGSATLIYDVLDFDVCVRSKDYLHFSESRSFPRARLLQAAGVEGVSDTVPLLVATSGWLNQNTGESRAIIAMGVQPHARTFARHDLQQQVERHLDRSDDLLIDTKTRREYGPANSRMFGTADVGRDALVSGVRFRIRGTYTLGAGLSASGTAMMTESGIRATLPYLADQNISLGLVRVDESSRSSEVKRRIEKLLPADVDVKTRSEVVADELDYWVRDTNYGLIFQTGVVLALFVGTAIVYQVLSSDVSTMLPEYATLKAIGYSNRDVAVVVLQQAVFLALAGYGIGILISQQLYLVTAAGAQIPMRLTAQNALLVFVLSLLMCVCSGIAALRKAFKADPAELF